MRWYFGSIRKFKLYFVSNYPRVIQIESLFLPLYIQVSTTYMFIYVVYNTHTVILYTYQTYIYEYFLPLFISTWMLDRSVGSMCFRVLNMYVGYLPTSKYLLRDQRIQIRENRKKFTSLFKIHRYIFEICNSGQQK